MSCHVGDAPLSCWSTAALRSTVVIFSLFRLRLVSNWVLFAQYFWVPILVLTQGFKQICFHSVKSLLVYCLSSFHFKVVLSWQRTDASTDRCWAGLNSNRIYSTHSLSLSLSTHLSRAWIFNTMDGNGQSGPFLVSGLLHHTKVLYLPCIRCDSSGVSTTLVLRQEDYYTYRTTKVLTTSTLVGMSVFWNIVLLQPWMTEESRSRIIPEESNAMIGHNY